MSYLISFESTSGHDEGICSEEKFERYLKYESSNRLYVFRIKH